MSVLIFVYGLHHKKVTQSSLLSNERDFKFRNNSNVRCDFFGAISIKKLFFEMGVRILYFLSVPKGILQESLS